MGPIALEPDHYLEHGSLAQAATEGRVELHGDDGDHHHPTARLELGESSREPHCHLCAHFGPQALTLKRLTATASVDTRPTHLHEAIFLKARLAKGPSQPRAPPRA